LGAKWARTRATAADLEYVATFAGEPDDFHVPDSLFYLTMDTDWKEVPRGPGSVRWTHFQSGAREVWQAVQPFLVELGKVGETMPPGSGGYSETVNPAYRLWLAREPAPEAPQADHDRWAAEEPAEFL
jgi:hypothetical protein